MIKKMMNGPSNICTCEKAGPRSSGIHANDWKKAGRDRWLAFTKANQELCLTVGAYKPPCLEAFVTPHRRCKHHQRLDTVMGHNLLDHWHSVSVGWKELCVVSQPYYPEAAGPWQLSEGDSVVVVNAGPDKSWYFPGVASLLLIGRPESIAKVNLTYSVSDCSPIPKGCR